MVLPLCAFSVPFVSAAPLLTYEFPESWDGVSTTVTDVSGAGHNGFLVGSLPVGVPLLSTNVTPNSPEGMQSVNTVGGGFRTNDRRLLSNSAIAGAGGFRFKVSFYWDGANGANQDVQKIIDYAGTEFLQLEDIDTINGTAKLRFGFNDSRSVGSNLITNIVAQQWYDVEATFHSFGKQAPNIAIFGHATLSVNGHVLTDNVFKNRFGDDLNRRIGIGIFSFDATSAELRFHGDIYSPSISLLPKAADFNSDDVVNAADLATWSNGFGTATAHSEGDADYDADVDGTDFLVWQQEFGFDASSLSPIPEPSAVLLTSLAVCTLAFASRRQR